MKKCEMCQSEIIRQPSKYESGRFCSTFCARRFSTYAKRKEINAIVSKQMQEKARLGTLPNSGRKMVKTIPCPICGKIFTSWLANHAIFCSKKCMNNDKDFRFKKKVSGGIREGSGRSKTGYYRGIWCQSTYELAYVIYNMDHTIPFTRNTETFEYEYGGEKHKYLPDFVENGFIIEIKGYFTEKVLLKANAVNKPIKILYLNDLLYAFDYIKQKYGKTRKTIQELYDSYKPKYSYECRLCKKQFSTDKKRFALDVFCSRTCCGKFRAFKFVR